MGTVADFFQLAASSWLQAMIEKHTQLYRQRPTATQIQAWQDAATVLNQALSCPHQQRWVLIFEYELPREGGRRPDVILLAGDRILVLEFKQKAAIGTADLDQNAAYGRDLRLYHPHCHERPVTPILVLTRSHQYQGQRNGVLTVAPGQLKHYLQELPPTDPFIDADEWVAAEYTPLPSVIQAARQIFQNQPLPAIKQAASAGIPDLLDDLNHLVSQAAESGQRHLVLITGVPGSGKTLVGLQLVYQNPLANADTSKALFLSGNGPLIQVLQYALKNRVFVQPVRNFYLQHEVRRQSAPPEHIIVFDEAQRAWDAKRMREKYGIDQAAGTAVLQIAERIRDWAVVVALIGEDQEIHVGEEEDIQQWLAAWQQAQKNWHVHCSPRHQEVFTAVGTQLHTADKFDLTTSLRTHQAEYVQEWINHLLAGEPEQAAPLVSALWSNGYRMYMTRDIEAAKEYCHSRYGGQVDKRYGLLASSRAKNLAKYDVSNDYKSTVRVKVGPWYMDPPDSPQSCCALTEVVTEFGCQGLELDFAIIAWGDDLIWQDSGWACKTRQRKVQNPRRLRINSYRVLLSRGRDGFCVFVPPEAKLDASVEALRQAGLPTLT